jgi:hypothetical protein
MNLHSLRQIGFVLVLAAWQGAALADNAPQTQQAIATELRAVPWVTQTRHKKPGDPVNVALVGTRDEIITAMTAAGWQAAAPVTVKTSAAIVGSVLLHKADLNAPVSALFFQGRQQDLAFEMEVGKSASRRHHVRFWKLRDDGPDGRPLWIAAATFDRGIGLSHRNGAVTHHISGDVDAERAFLMDTLNKALRIIQIVWVQGHGPVKARNGGGDAYWSDGNILAAVIAPAAAQQASPAAAPSP